MQHLVNMKHTSNDAENVRIPKNVTHELNYQSDLLIRACGYGCFKNWEVTLMIHK